MFNGNSSPRIPYQNQHLTSIQFFYFDAEEYGFETYKSLLGGDSETLTITEQALIGGLGGSKVNVSEREATFLVQKTIHDEPGS